MRSKTSVLNKGYLRFLLKKTWPIAVAFGILLLAYSFFFMLMNSVSSLLYDYMSVSDLSYSSYSWVATNITSVVLLDTLIRAGIFFMGVFSLALCLSMFGTLYRRSSSDFVGCAPISRVSVQLSSVFLGTLYIAVMSLLSTLMVSLFSVSSGVLAFTEVVRYFLLLLCGSLVIFGLCCLCAAASSNDRGLILSALVCVVCVPAVFYAVQVMCLGIVNDSIWYVNDKYASSTVEAFYPYIKPLSLLSVHSRLTLPSKPLDVLLCVLNNVALFLGYTAFGTWIMKKKRFEVTDRCFVKEKWTNILLGCLFLPVILLNAYSNSLFSSVTVSTLIPGAFFVLLFLGVAILVRKGFTKFWQSVLAYVVTVVVAVCITLLSSYVIGPAIAGAESYTDKQIAEAESVTLVVPYDDVRLLKGQTWEGKTVTITDKKVIAAFCDTCEHSYYEFDTLSDCCVYLATVKLSDGTTFDIEYSYMSFASAYQKLYSKTLQEAFLDDRDAPLDEPICVMLEAIDETGGYCYVDVTSVSMIRAAKEARSAFRKLSSTERRKALADLASLDYSTVDSEGNNYYTLTEKPANGSSSDYNTYLHVVTYRDGNYYKEIIPLAAESDVFKAVVQSQIDRAKTMARLDVTVYSSYGITWPSGFEKQMVEEMIAKAEGQIGKSTRANVISLYGEKAVLFCDSDEILAKYYDKYIDTVKTELKKYIDNQSARNITVYVPFSIIVFDSIDYCEPLLQYIYDHFDETRACMKGELDEEDCYSVNFSDKDYTYRYLYTFYIKKDTADQNLFLKEMADKMTTMYGFTSADIECDGKTITVLQGDESGTYTLRNIVSYLQQDDFYYDSSDSYYDVTVTLHYGHRDDYVISGLVPDYCIDTDMFKEKFADDAWGD